MFGKKKDKIEAPPEPPTPVITTRIGKEPQMIDMRQQQVKYIVEEFQKSYMSILGEKDLEELNADTLSLNLLFAIYGELRLARQEREGR